FKKYNLYLALFLSVLVFLLTTPFAILDSSKFLTDLKFDRQHYTTGHPGMEGNTLAWYLNYLWQTMGFIVLLAVLEIFRAFQTRSRQMILLSVFPLVYFIFISRLIVRNERTLLPLTPFLFLLAASLLVYLFNRIELLTSDSRRRLLMICLAFLS